MISMKGGFAQVIKPISEKVVMPFLKSWQYWGKVEADFMQIREGSDLIGFYIFVDTSRGSYLFEFKRKTDVDGLFYWEQVKEEAITPQNDPRTVHI